MSANETLETPVIETGTCVCGQTSVTFRPQEAKDLAEDTIRLRWPRGWCDRCHTVVYASYLHYLSGGW